LITRSSSSVKARMRNGPRITVSFLALLLLFLYSTPYLANAPLRARNVSHFKLH